MKEIVKINIDFIKIKEKSTNFIEKFCLKGKK